MLRYKLIAKGRVQGVGFRFFAQYQALQYDLTGWVKNEFDGTVSLEVQGEEEKINRFITALYEGDRFINVKGIKKEEIPCKSGENSFRITY